MVTRLHFGRPVRKFTKYPLLASIAALFLTIASPRIQGDTEVSARKYFPSQLQEIRLHDKAWTIGTLDPGNRWNPLPFEPKLNTDFFDGTNGPEQAREGVGMAGRSAHLVFFPLSDLPEGVRFSVNPLDLFAGHRIEIPVGEYGSIYLDRNRYAQMARTVNGLDIEIDSEPGNPAIDVALKTLDIFTRLFPYRTQAFQSEGKLTVVLVMNSTEKFTDEPVKSPNGHHYVEPRLAIQYTQDGTGEDVFEHALHEIGGLFRIPDNDFAHGLTWMIAYDQVEKNAKSEEEKRVDACFDLGSAIGSIRSTAIHSDESKDFTHTIEYYLGDVDGTGGYPMYAWGSAVFWKQINRQLEAKGAATLYDLINSIHRTGLDSSTAPKDLDKLLAAYKALSPRSYPLFAGLVTKYFRQSTLGDLVLETLATEKSQGCRALIDAYLAKKSAKPQG